MRDRVIVDPIQNTYSFGGGDHAHSGPNLEPSANLRGADLNGAALSGADLHLAELEYADLSYADLIHADLTYAYLSNADLSNANLYNANLSNAYLDYANLSNARLFSTQLVWYQGEAENWITATWTGAKYSLNAVDNNGNPIPDTVFPANMDQAWRDAAGMVAVPETTTAVLVGVGLIGLGVRRRVS